MCRAATRAARMRPGIGGCLAARWRPCCRAAPSPSLLEHPLDLGDAFLVALIERPLLELLGAQDTDGGEQPQVLACGGLAHAQLVGDEQAADPISHQIAVTLGWEVRYRVLQPLQDDQPLLARESLEHIDLNHLASMLTPEVIRQPWTGAQVLHPGMTLGPDLQAGVSTLPMVWSRQRQATRSITGLPHDRGAGQRERGPDAERRPRLPRAGRHVRAGHLTRRRSRRNRPATRRTRASPRSPP